MNCGKRSAFGLCDFLCVLCASAVRRSFVVKSVLGENRTGKSPCATNCCRALCFRLSVEHPTVPLAAAAPATPLAPGAAGSYAVLSMARAPRLLTTEPELYDAAVGALARRSHSVHEMRQYLERRSGDPSLAASVLSRLRAGGLVDDARYARQFARDRSANRRQGRFRLARELRARGVGARHIAAAIEELASQAEQLQDIIGFFDIAQRMHVGRDVLSVRRLLLLPLHPIGKVLFYNKIASGKTSSAWVRTDRK